MQSSRNDRSRMRGGSHNQSQSSQSQAMLQGEVASITRLGTQDRSQHTVLRLTLENGRSAFVDLGPGAAPSKIGLDAGDQVTIRGHLGRVGDRRVIVADRLRINDTFIQ